MVALFGACGRRTSQLTFVSASTSTCCDPSLCDRREGNKTLKKEPGPVVFVLKALPHKRFTRRGADLVHKVTLPLYQCLCGASVEVATLDHRCAEGG